MMLREVEDFFKFNGDFKVVVVEVVVIGCVVEERFL